MRAIEAKTNIFRNFDYLFVNIFWHLKKCISIRIFVSGLWPLQYDSIPLNAIHIIYNLIFCL